MNEDKKPTEHEFIFNSKDISQRAQKLYSEIEEMFSREAECDGVNCRCMESYLSMLVAVRVHAYRVERTVRRMVANDEATNTLFDGIAEIVASGVDAENTRDLLRALHDKPGVELRVVSLDDEDARQALETLIGIAQRENPDPKDPNVQ